MALDAPTGAAVQEEDSRVHYERMWALIRSYFNQHGLVRHQLESYNYFMTNLLPHIVQENSTFEVEKSREKSQAAEGTEVPAYPRHFVSICNVSVVRPTTKECDRFDESVTPHVCRLRGITYCTSVLADVVHDIVRKGQPKEMRVFREVLIAKIPAMVRSDFCTLSGHGNDRDECPMDPGGYFIINGVEKTLLAQEKLHTNRIFIFSHKPPSKTLYTCEVRSCHELKLVLRPHAHIRTAPLTPRPAHTSPRSHLAPLTSRPAHTSPRSHLAPLTPPHPPPRSA